MNERWLELSTLRECSMSISEWAGSSGPRNPTATELRSAQSAIRLLEIGDVKALFPDADAVEENARRLVSAGNDQ
jgi:hypothetical protein